MYKINRSKIKAYVQTKCLWHIQEQCQNSEVVYTNKIITVNIQRGAP